MYDMLTLGIHWCVCVFFFFFGINVGHDVNSTPLFGAPVRLTGASDPHWSPYTRALQEALDMSTSDRAHPGSGAPPPKKKTVFGLAWKYDAVHG